MAGRGMNIRRLDYKSKKECAKVRLLAKYSYRGNPDKPGGFQEVTLTQFEKVWLLNKGFGENALWWEVEKDNGEQGYAPARYLTIIEEGVTSLPWLKKNGEPKMDQGVTEGNTFGMPKVKPYVPTYSENKKMLEGSNFCDVCQRSFNGPIPFRAHMNSKVHKEEERVAREYNF